MRQYVAMPKTAAVVGRNVALAKRLLRKHGFSIVGKNPQLVVTVGGDGSILHSERRYPGVPKLCMREGEVCARCGSLGGRKMLWHCPKCVDGAIGAIAASKKIAVRLERKLEGTAIVRRGGKVIRKTLLALNEVQVHNNSPLHAVRGTVAVNGSKVADFIGDGVIVATPYGSTGYYYAACRKTFKRGIGVCFNNPTRPMETIALAGNAVVEITVTRRHGLFVADNDPETGLLDVGDRVVVRYSKESARFVEP